MDDLFQRLAARYPVPASPDGAAAVRAAEEVTRADRECILAAFGLPAGSERAINETHRDADLTVHELHGDHGRLMYAALSSAPAAVHAAEDEELWRHALGGRYDDVRRRHGRRTLHGRRLAGSLSLAELTLALIAWTLDGGPLERALFDR